MNSVSELSMHASMMLEESSEDFCPGEAAEERLQLFHESWSRRGGGANTTTTTTTTPRRGASCSSSSSSLVPPQNRKDLNRYDEGDFHYGRIVGKGSFSTAHCVYLRSSNRNFRRGGHKEESGQAYALKKLQPRVYKEKKLLKTAVSDLALEAEILANLKHENIITLYGVKEGDMIQSLKDGSFFLVLDLLVETLDVRMLRWLAKRRPVRAKIRSEGVRARLQDVALGIAKGMEYLHSKHIIFR
jgi:serine/threonine protein kinase